MACGCNKIKKDTSNSEPTRRTGPLDQCLFCAQKHADEALVAMNEFMYRTENRSFVHGSLRAVVNHTFKTWPGIAMKAREAALLWQEARFDESQSKLEAVILDIDDTLLSENPEIQERIKEAEDAKKKQGSESNERTP